ncbi:hypothetical protein niasHT_004679 [Heterodera trifolii]|uniref:SURP motif domain-containing protein n=1 Tax=Heterodera trifolii TaxID=157864 RepID=A0ABD2MBN3_9BILA
MASHHHQHRRKTKHRHGSVHNGRSNDSQNDEFLVFGYSAKLHNPRDEHRSAEEQPFDESIYLIPWNGDDRLKIDRYDVRLYLSSLDEFDEEKQRKRSIADSAAAEEEQDTAEKLEEELCEEERFLDLYEDIRKRELEEANQKRGKGAEIGFTYEEGETDKIDMVGECEETTAEDEQPYEQPQSLKLPVGIVTPETMKQNALIERTAQFVVTQGPQMEVVIKAKQRQNAEQFGFLDFDHRLHPYYKYMCKLIREKKYVPQPKQQLTKKRIVEEFSESDTDTENEGDGYLHPSLLGGLSKAKVGEGAPSPQPGFIGPSPRPPPQKVERKPASPGPDLDVLVQQFHRSSSGNSLYSSLLKGLHSVLPGSSLKVENSVNLEAEPPPQTHIDEAISKAESVGIPSLFESDQQQRTDDYNKWHMEFYGRPSPFIPGHPPVCQRPVPDSAVESAISVAAKYVALHGAYAEQRLIEHNQDKVHFLQARSPYYTFYQSQVRQIQWKIFQQSQQNRQQSFHAPQLFTTPFDNIAAVPSPPPPSAAELMKMPSDKQMADAIEKGEEGMEPKEAEPDSKQLERREKARLFMERILNERMAEKHRTKTDNKPNKEEKDNRGTVSETPSTSAASAGGVAVQPLPSSALTPLALSKAISCLIDEQIKRTLGTSPPQSPAEARKKKRGKRREGEERRRRRKKRRTRSYSSESSSSSPSSSTDSNEEERSRKRRRRRKTSKRRKRGREHGSESDSSDDSGGEEEEKRRRRRKRKQKGQEEGDSSLSHRYRRHHHRSRSRSPRR